MKDAASICGPASERQRLEFEVLISGLSARFVNISPERLDDEIRKALGEILEFFRVDRCALIRSARDRTTWLITHIAYSADTPEVPEEVELPRSLHPWAYEKLVERNEVVSFSRIDDVPAEAAVDRKTWIEWGIRSNLVIPVVIGGAVDHVIAINSITSEQHWPSEFIPRLRLLGEIFVNAMERRNAEQALRESEERLRLAASSAQARLWEIDPETEVIWATEFGRKFYGLKPGEDLAIDQFLERVHPEDRQRVRQSLEQARSGAELIVEYRSEGTPGNLRWIVSRGRLTPRYSGKKPRVMGVSIDVTERKALEDRLREQLDEIERLKRKLEEENIVLRDQLLHERHSGTIIGNSDVLNYVLFRAGQVAPTDATVLILGETGTGKGLIAQAVHELSRRKDRPMITVNCAALPENLIESELFGREKGAFTGAHARQAGRFEVADKGTIYLDELGELPLQLQSKLLRVIQDGEFERLGSPKTIKVDVRVIASTSRDLKEEMRAGKFREDLFYRLNVFPISMPPLRDRLKDIPHLVRFFVEKYARKIGRRIETIPMGDMKALENYHWPGNIRELEHFVERAVILAEGPVLRLVDNLEPVRLAGAPDVPPKDLAAMEREHILQVLLGTNWRIEGPSGAAAILHIHPSTLRFRMKKLGIRRSG